MAWCAERGEAARAAAAEVAEELVGEVEEEVGEVLRLVEHDEVPGREHARGRGVGLGDLVQPAVRAAAAAVVAVAHGVVGVNLHVGQARGALTGFEAEARVVGEEEHLSMRDALGHVKDSCGFAAAGHGVDKDIETLQYTLHHRLLFT
eukprot:CAMPEP_0113675198 /NCGR_PEP_ID=MMETSP0038_2-20120614/7874_1 /TAXON_ID=2898 /ORGANISM="Cryptomonas paramecium" /LENGTH=147 /DNA_ID=CAMNT_0000591929 /DNA_START=22 /DNA_END=465 /DNA_ORIENTATION=+ /assembly_acc=CAM_ASM_000170